MADLTILDLVANKTLSARVAAVLWAAMDARLSFIVTAVPRFAGKSTLMNAMLGLLPPDFQVHRLDGSTEQMRRLKQDARGGYLVEPEISQAPVPDYIWGEPVRELFDTITAGYSLATALHAPDIQGTFDVLCRENGVSDEAASQVNLVLHLLRFGDEAESFWRRLAEVSEVHGVSGGRPSARVLFQWQEEADTFEDIEPPRLLNIDSAELDRRTALIEERVRSGRTDAASVRELVLSRQ